MSDVESDAACVGTAAHAAVEVALNARKDGVDFDRSDLVELFQMEFTEQMTNPAFTWIKYTERSARKFGALCVAHFHDAVYHTIPVDCALETRFILPFHESDERVIELSGAIDLIADRRISDLKTSGRGPYAEWEYGRWAIQPSVYTWAAVQLGLIDDVGCPGCPAERGDGDGCCGNPLAIPFDYVVMHAKGVHQFTVQRPLGHWNFLEDKVVRLAELIEAQLERWPLNDNHALCSAKWCPNWASCKGSHGIEI